MPKCDDASDIAPSSTAYINLSVMKTNVDTGTYLVAGVVASGEDAS